MKMIAVIIVLVGAPALSGSPKKIELIRGFERPEDVELVAEAGALVVSEMGFETPLRGGGISALPWTREAGPFGPPHRIWPAADALPPARRFGSPDCTSPPNPDGFSGHGLSVASSHPGPPLLAIVGHGTREAIEYFELHGSGAGLRARWVGCVELPPDTAGNDLVVASDGSVFVTNYIPTVHGLRAWVWLQLASGGWDTGNVLKWQAGGGWSELAGSEGPMPNGILRLGSRMVVAYNGASRLSALEKNGEKLSVALPGAPDNLSSGPDGGILAAILQDTSPGAWSIVRVDRELRDVEIVLSHDGTRLSAVTSVVFDGARYLLGTMSGDSIGVAE